MARGIPALSRLEMLTRAARLLIMSTYSRSVALAMFYSFWMILMAGGCITPEISSEGPDLIAVPDGSFGGPDAFCDTTTVPQLRIVIQNQGQGNAPASMTRVNFSPGGIKDIPTLPLQSTQRTMLAPVPLPAACLIQIAILRLRSIRQRNSTRHRRREQCDRGALYPAMTPRSHFAARLKAIASVCSAGGAAACRPMSVG